MPVEHFPDDIYVDTFEAEADAEQSQHRQDNLRVTVLPKTAPPWTALASTSSQTLGAKLESLAVGYTVGTVSLTEGPGVGFVGQKATENLTVNCEQQRSRVSQALAQGGDEVVAKMQLFILYRLLSCSWWKSWCSGSQDHIWHQRIGRTDSRETMGVRLWHLK